MTLTVLLFWISFFLSTLVIVLQCLSIHYEILIMFFSQFLLNFHQTLNEMPHFIAKLLTILDLIGMVFVIIWEIFHGRISLTQCFFYCRSGFSLELLSGLEKISGTITQIVWWNIANCYDRSLCLLFFLYQRIFFVCVKKKLYGSFLWMTFNCFKTREPLPGGSLLFTTKFP